MTCSTRSVARSTVAAHCPTRYLAVNVGILSNNPAPTPMHRVALEWVRTRPVEARTTHFVVVRVRD